MAIIDKTVDFKGQYRLPRNCFDNLDIYIAKFEKWYLINLLGAELYDLFIADLTATTPQVPQTTRFLDIFNAFHEDDGTCVRKSEGIRQMLVQFLYFELVRDSNYSKTQSGVVRDEVEASGVILKGYNDVQAYNEGVRNYDEIQWFICDNDEDYPEENVQSLEPISGI